MRPDTHHYRELFLNDVPLMDARAPIEFNKGAFPGALNLPLMNDEERHQVGICYKQHGQDAAIALGNKLVSGQIKKERLQAWVQFTQAHPDGYLYCFRGGLRSQITQTWLREEAGIRYPRVVGGYKAMRGFLLHNLEQTISSARFQILGGMTGTGKTDVLQQLDHSLDLEGYAHHRGSSFGKHATGQPSQIDFEHRLSISMLKKTAQGHQGFVLEDESQTIGRCSLPLSLYRGMQQWPIIWLEDSLENRITRIVRDYVQNLHAEFTQQHDPQTGFALFAEQLRQSLARITKRLGHQRYQQLSAIMDAALQEQERSGALDGHRDWIGGLLTQYYDPMYSYQREQKKDRVIFQGDAGAVLNYLRRHG
ncbi:tRNA 2-selenouridine(34) synthase MnmH [Alcaligenes faecalis]|uniref:tRNA 2-selenouridine synthase n=1 Tax=Alcaligenes faecalis TaxID=511 RepID=A0A2U2BJ18_ALCFA|nr:tRNA 2-selenouridine(34) synthase MnmH [Alcaligenes faecalis]PWE13967.1 tRNA 2-selenouridine(34) synthase MnmH [Alcaligenes faecalis]WHQ42647.1 tRNA 2-selenouridine(34) synthase MnmH [Alcaligenes faecalis]